MKKAIIILVLLFIVGGFAAIGQALGIWGQMLIGFFPFFAPVIEQAIEDYLTSGYFITGVVIFILSTVGGIALTIKQRKALYIIISGIIDIIALISIISNLTNCTY